MLDHLIKQYAEKGYYFAYRLSGNVEESKELVQEAFARILSTWDRYDPSQSFDRYFLTIVKNIYYDYVSRKSSLNLSLDAPINPQNGLETFADQLADREEPLLERLMRRETAKTVEECLWEISGEYRAILTLCDMEGFSYEQIAQTLGCPLGTVRSRIARARRALKIKLLERFKEVPL